MMDVTREIVSWLAKCQALRDSELIKDEGSLYAAEEAHLKESLLSRLGSQEQDVLSLIKAIEVEYLDDVDDVRQFCVRQRSGSIYCEPKKVEICSGSRYEIRAIDPRGTMSGAGPYVEVLYERGFILEPVSGLRFWLNRS